MDNPGPMVVFASPGMLHAGLSLQLFKKWAPDPKNMVRYRLLAQRLLYACWKLFTSMWFSTGHLAWILFIGHGWK